MLFPQKMNTSAKGPKWARMRQQTWDKWMDGWICLLLLFLLRAFYCVQTNSLCKYIMEELSSRNWCITQECGSIQRRSWSQFVNEMSHKLAYQQNDVVSTKWYHLGINATFFATEARIYLKGVLMTFHFVLFWGWGVRLDFL